MSAPRYRFFTITAALVFILLLIPSAYPQQETQKDLDHKTKQRMLKREAASALRRFKLRLEKEGFYSGRVALNVWRSTAIDAGTFDQEKFNDFKRQLYEKSVNDSMKCFDEFILEENYHDANVCLQTWRMHSKELGTYEQAEYEALKKRLADARTAKASESKTTPKAPK
ncbi:MAG: hypothetical protein GY850_40675 [bacterium]|nr:hypothetical protein [bacterium]